MSRLGTLKSAITLSDLAKLLRFKPAGLSYILFKQAPAAKYKTFEIPKRNGGTRTIKAPTSALKLVQQRLSVLLQDCLDEINAAKKRKDRIAHGFKRKRSIVTNATQHRKRRFVFNLDLQDFFPSINFGRVRGFFMRDHTFALNKHVATVIAQIACDENALPQGSPCSPVISNLIAHVLDVHLVRLASRSGCTYSRYADDLTFSTNEKVFPAEIAVPSATDPHRWIPGKELERLVHHSGFLINPTKTHMQYRTSRQEVTGLIVNSKVNVRHEYRHRVRAMVHRLLKSGAFEIYAPAQQPGNLMFDRRNGTLNELHGMLGFIDGIDLHNKKKHGPAKGSAPLSSNELMYRRFLIYRMFYSADAPVIICEGDTDNVYLVHAIRSLAANFPDLAAIAPNGKITLRVRLYRYRRSSTARVTGLGGGGSSALAKFISTYNHETAKFTAPGTQQPLVILYDNDSGADSIRSAIKQIRGKGPTAAEPFVRAIRNLYAMPTPLPAGAQESKIEDFFEATVKAAVINGKTFSAENNIDPAKHYGKRVFAHSVVRPNANAINFGGFIPLLTNLVSIIHAHAAALAPAAVP